MADMMAMFFVGQNCSVDSYVYVPDCAESVMWLAKYTNKRHKHYEKKMVPSTACVKRLISDVVLVSCHASPRDAHTSEPAVLLFHDGVDSVSVLGVQQGTPDALKIWSCSSYTDRGSNQTYTKPAGSISLSEVVQDSRLVLLLSCHGGDIIQEYASEAHAVTNPDFLVFEKDAVRSISVNIFLSLFISAVERSTIRQGDWHVFLRRNICRVLLWVKKHGGTPRKFWNFMRNIIGCVLDGRDETVFQVKGCVNYYELDKDTAPIILEDLQALTLVTFDGGEARVRCTHTQDELQAMVRPLDHQCSQMGGTVDLDSLLLQLRGLLRGA
jgi:hypothetical protein